MAYTFEKKDNGKYKLIKTVKKVESKSPAEMAKTALEEKIEKEKC